MWIVKGVLLGVLFFIFGWMMYLGVGMAVSFYRVDAQGQAYIWSQLIHSPALWISLLMAIGIGLWIARARARTTHTA